MHTDWQACKKLDAMGSPTRSLIGFIVQGRQRNAVIYRDVRNSKLIFFRILFEAIYICAGLMSGVRRSTHGHSIRSIEATQAPRGVGFGEGVSPYPMRVGSGRGLLPLENFWIFFASEWCFLRAFWHMIRQFTGFKDKDKDLMLKDKDNNTGLHVSEEWLTSSKPF